MPIPTLREVIADPEVAHNVQTLIAALSIARGADSANAVPLDVHKAKLAMTVCIAAFLEMDPELAAPAKRRAALDDERQMLKHFIKALEGMRAATGKTIFDLMGVTEGKPFSAAADSTGTAH